MITALLFSTFHLTQLMPVLLLHYSWAIYLGLFAMIFIETGLVVFPFLPGDSILFLTGSMAAMTAHSLNPILLIIILATAAITGDTVNFEIGHRLGRHLGHSWLRHLIKPTALKRAERFFQAHGNSAIFLGRFMPVIRTLIPFTAGASKMSYRKFIFFNIFGGIVWVSVAILAGYFFGNIAIVKAHFDLILLGIVALSLIPAGFMALKKRRSITPIL